MPKLLDIPIDDITVADRHRQDLGDLGELADSIEKVGLLQPIGVTKDKRLVFGERRLEAVKFLNWKTIPARVIEIERIVDGEYAENEMRKDFTLRERSAILDAIEAGMGNRQGQRTDLDEHGADRSQVEPGKKTRDVAAKKAGFSSATVAARVRKVVKEAAEEVVAAMDSGALSVDAAAVIADQPEAEQKRIAALPKAEQKKAVAELREQKAAKRPSPEEAKRLAMETGQPVIDSKGVAQSPMAPEKETRMRGSTALLYAAEKFLKVYDEWAEDIEGLVQGFRDSPTKYAEGVEALGRVKAASARIAKELTK